jgi:hypothetical protein
MEKCLACFQMLFLHMLGGAKELNEKHEESWVLGSSKYQLFKL